MSILCFHTVEDDWDRTLALTTAEFERTCAWLARNREVVDLNTALDRLDHRFRPPGRTTAITFDDGWAGVASTAWPILRDHGLPMTLFVIADSMLDPDIDLSWVDNPPDQPMSVLDADAIRTLHAEGVTIGSHSLRHADLRQLDRQECLRDLTESKRILEDTIGAPVDVLAYPKGHHNGIVRAAAEEAGYRWALSLPEAREPAGRWSVPRIGVYPGNNERTLWIKTRRRYLDARLHPAWPGNG